MIDIGNEKIARFMGYPIKVEVTNFNYGMDYHHSYDRDLNSIIEVLRKIDSLGYFNHIKESYLSLNIDKIWISVVEFIEWYERDSKIENIVN